MKKEGEGRKPVFSSSDQLIDSAGSKVSSSIPCLVCAVLDMTVVIPQKSRLWSTERAVCVLPASCWQLMLRRGEVRSAAANSDLWNVRVCVLHHLHTSSGAG